MAKAVLFSGWTQAKPGREQVALELFQQAMGVYGKWQSEGKIDSFEPVLLRPHGGDLNGFVLFRGDQAKLDALRASEEWIELEARGILCIEGLGTIPGWVGEGLQHIMQVWAKHIPHK